MTHDELLIEINRRLDVALYNGDPQIAHALRAVVEYIKPNDWDFTDERYNKLEIFKIIERELK
jgi:hypothetical protein